MHVWDSKCLRDHGITWPNRCYTALLFWQISVGPGNGMKAVIKSVFSNTLRKCPDPYVKRQDGKKHYLSLRFTEMADKKEGFAAKKSQFYRYIWRLYNIIKLCGIDFWGLFYIYLKFHFAVYPTFNNCTTAGLLDFSIFSMNFKYLFMISLDMCWDSEMRSRR